MLQSKKTIVAAIAAAVAVILVYNFAVAEDPTYSTPNASTADQTVTPSPIPGWVQKEIQFRMPVMVPQGMPVGPPEDIVLGAPPQMPFAPPIPGPDFVPPWVPEWAKQGIPVPPGFPFPMTQVTPKSADPGSLKVQERRIPDSLGGQYLMRERTWTTDGIPHRELTIVDPPAQASSLPIPPKGPTTPQTTPEKKSMVVPETGKKRTTELKTVPSVKKTPQKPSTTQQNTPSPKATDNRLDRQAQQPTWLPPAGAAGIAVTADPKQGTRIYQYRQGNPTKGTQLSTGTHVFSNIQGQPGADNMIGVGVSTDSTGDTRVYRYYRGNGANVPSQPAKKTTP